METVHSHLLILFGRKDPPVVSRPPGFDGTLLMYLLFSYGVQLKEFQQKSSPTSVGAEKVGGGAGAKKKRKVKGPSQHDAASTDRSSPDNVSPRISICFPAYHHTLCGQTALSLCRFFLMYGCFICTGISVPSSNRSIHITYNLQHSIKSSFSIAVGWKIIM